MKSKGKASESSDEEALFDSEEEEQITYSSSKRAGHGATTVEPSYDQELPAQEMIVEKVLGRKIITIENGGMEELYFIKWKGLSYLHASWERREDIEQVDPNGKLKLKRFLQTPQAPGILGELSVGKGDNNEDGQIEAVDEEEIEYFSPDLVEVQRIISCNIGSCSHSKAKKPSDLVNPSGMTMRKRKSVEEEEEEAGIQYLVKWRGLPYDECTWEKWSDIQSYYREVWLFWQQQRSPGLPIHHLPFPALQDYKKLEQSPAFGISTVLPLEDDEIPTEGLKLRDYQLEGVNWLLWNWWHKRSCILADEMGLGKTIQTITFLHQLRYMKCTKINGPFLIIAPLSLIDQWYSEIATWSPDMNCVLLHGNSDARETIYAREFYFQEPFVSKNDARALKNANALKFHILLTTFEVAVKEISKLARINWKLMIIDEAHKLKNAQSRIFSTLSTIPREHCVLLTGTPLQNKTEELWALLNFADSTKFSNLEDFMNKFGDLKNVKQVAKLHDTLKPYLLRRIKEDVEKSLPPKEETIVEVALTSIQKRFYRAIFEKNTAYLYKGLKASNQPSLMNVMMELRKCCNHPYLVRGVEERVLAEITPEEKNEESIVMKKMIECSGKLVLLDKLLPRLFSQGHKVLIFSQMVRVLNLLEDFLKFRGYSFERLDGSSRSSDRKDAVERFCKPSANKFIMLLSTKAGGLGLNLTAADTVIIFDSDWNPQNDLQAQARAHRIGQTKAVMVYRLLTRKTYEMEMFHQASMKLGLDRAVLAHARIEQGEDGEKESIDVKLSLKEIDALLKRGAYDVFREDDSEQKEFEEADIDSILQRRAHKVVYNEGATSISSLGNFSKASFVSADEKEDVDINDPDFWKKAVGLKEDAGGELNEPEEVIVLNTQRKRKQTTVYGEMLHEDEDEIRRALKQSRTAKGDKNEKLAQKAAQKEQQLKERQEREEARKLKLQEEQRLKNDPKTWGSHGRDRILRALNMFGWGRWHKIKCETNKEMMETKDLEAFCNYYMFQCGLCAYEQDPSTSTSYHHSHKDDSHYVTNIIREAKEIETLTQLGKKKVIDFPPALSESRFVLKLKAGLAKKSLNKLEILSKLNLLMQDVFQSLKAKKEAQEAASTDDNVDGDNGDEEGKKENDLDMETDLDKLMEQFTIEEITAAIPFGDIRPPWARSCQWWDLECDKHLVLGVFKYGYGQYEEMKDDDGFVFKRKLVENLSKSSTNNGGVALGMSTSATSAGIASGMRGSTSLQNLQDHGVDMDDNELLPLDMLMDEDDAVLMDKSMMMEDGDDVDDDHDNLPGQNGSGGGSGGIGGSSGIGKSGAHNTQPGFMPDPRHLNRIISWLVTSDTARLTQADLLEKDRRDRKGNNLKISEGRSSTDTPSFEEQVLPAADQGPNQMARVTFEIFKASMDVEPMSLVFKQQIQGLKKCSTLLDEADDLENTSDDTSMDLEETADPTADGNVLITENDAMQLGAAFILYGAPIEDNQYSRLYPIAKELFGIENDMDRSASSSTKSFSWKSVKRMSKVAMSEGQIEYYFIKVWLPFCQKLLAAQQLPPSSSASDKTVPSPFVAPNDHNLVARGLCQLSLLRQQTLYAVNYILTYHFKSLLDYLRDNRGRSVDNMPVWWCPWIHDLALLLGILKHGYLVTEKIFTDPDLPFHRDYLMNFIRKVFLIGTDRVPPIGKYDLRNTDEAERFVIVSASHYPDIKELEVRIFRIVEELTSHLSIDHPCKVSITSQSFRTIISQASSSTNNMEEQAKTKTDSKVSRNILRGPTVSLNAFVNTSRKRRKAYVVSYHQELTSGK